MSFRAGSCWFMMFCADVKIIANAVANYKSLCTRDSQAAQAAYQNSFIFCICSWSESSTNCLLRSAVNPTLKPAYTLQSL